MTIALSVVAVICLLLYLKQENILGLKDCQTINFIEAFFYLMCYFFFPFFAAAFFFFNVS